MHGGFQLDPWSAARIVEVGDVPFPRANENEACIEQMSEFYGRIDAAGTRPTSIAGDHSLTGGIVQAIRRGSIADGELVAFLHLDAHTDVFTKVEHFLGARKSAAHLGSPSCRSGAGGFQVIDPDRAAPAHADALLNRSILCLRLQYRDDEGVPQTRDRRCRRPDTGRAGRETCYITFYLDCLDPAIAPTVTRGNRLTTGVSQQDPYNGKGNDSDKSAANRRIHAVLCSRRHLVVQLPRCRSHGSAGNSRAGCRFGMFGQMPGFNATPWRPAPKAASPDELAVDCLVQLQKGIEHRAMLQGLTVGTRCLLRDRASIALAAVRRPDPSRGELKVCSMKNRIAGRQGERVRAVATIEVMQGPFQRGNDDDPVRNSSTARAHCRPSRMAQTTSD